MDESPILYGAEMEKNLKLVFALAALGAAVFIAWRYGSRLVARLRPIPFVSRPYACNRRGGIRE